MAQQKVSAQKKRRCGSRNGAFRFSLFQFVDLKEKLISRGEFESVVSAIVRTAGSRAAALELMADKNSKDYASFAYLDDTDKEAKLFENQLLLNLPICRNGKTTATCGLDTKTWEEWK